MSERENLMAELHHYRLGQLIENVYGHRETVPCIFNMDDGEEIKQALKEILADRREREGVPA